MTTKEIFDAINNGRIAKFKQFHTNCIISYSEVYVYLLGDKYIGFNGYGLCACDNNLKSFARNIETDRYQFIELMPIGFRP